MKRWRRYGKNRLYVVDGDVRLGWHDLDTEETVIEVPERAGEVHAALGSLIRRPAAPDSVPATADSVPVTADPVPATPDSVSVTADSVPVTTPEASASLTDHRAGELARRRAEAEWEAAKQRSKLRAYLVRILGAHTDERAWRLGAQGEELVGRALTSLPPGWHVLHSVPVGTNGSDIDHVVIGPAGVFTINTKHHPRKKVSVYPKAVYVGGTSVPYLRNSRHEAARAGRLLSAAVGWTVPVTPVLAFVNTSRVTLAKGGPSDVLINHRRLVKALTGRTQHLEPMAVEAIWQAAQRPELWVSGGP